MYVVKFDCVAIDVLEKLPQPIAKRIWTKLQQVKTNPHRYFERLKARSDYKLRVGDYRVVADIDDSLQEIRVTLIGHRKNVYDT